MLTPESTSHSANLFTISPHQKFNENMHKNDRQLAVTTDAMKFKNEKDEVPCLDSGRGLGRKCQKYCHILKNCKIYLVSGSVPKILPYFEKLQNTDIHWQ